MREKEELGNCFFMWADRRRSVDVDEKENDKKEAQALEWSQENQGQNEACEE